MISQYHVSLSPQGKFGWELWTQNKVEYDMACKHEEIGGGLNNIYRQSKNKMFVPMRSKLNNQQHSFSLFSMEAMFHLQDTVWIMTMTMTVFSSIDSGCQAQLKWEVCHLECDLSECLVQTCMSEVKPVWMVLGPYSALKFDSKVCILNNTIF